MTTQSEQALKNKFELYFFDPFKDEDKYSKLFKKFTKKENISYSPLYMLRRNILILSNKLNCFNKSIKQTPYFSAFILSNIAISGLKKLTHCKDYKKFYLKYLGKDTMQYLGLRIFRNAIEHNNYQLYTRVYKNNKNLTGGFYKEIIEHVSYKQEKKFENINFIKIAYSLSKLDNGKTVIGPDIEKEYDDYILIRFRIDPFQYFDKFEEAIVKIVNEINSNDDLLSRFDKEIIIDNWMTVYY